MKLHELLGTVCDVAGVEQTQAEKVTRAFLETLAVRLSNDEASELAAQLPAEMQDCLAPTEPEIEKLSPDDFLARFSEAAGLDQARAEQAAHGVWEALNRTVAGGEMGDVRSQLPNELVDLFEGRRAPNPSHQAS